MTAPHYHVDATNPGSRLVDISGYDEHTVSEINSVMAALGRLRQAERELVKNSQDYMKLSETDMRAVHFIIACHNKGVVATPGAIAAHLDITAASTTKLLDRLERGGHITRQPHPSDRRALAIAVTDSTRRAATESIGRQQARRFYAAARLTSEEREVVTRFLDDMTREISTVSEEAAAKS